ncbi:MAG: hypothetical protein FRX49_09052 [Trebouxia sp. A1-2]|nr:MAG: hypothetical protein FRX49_09052 [Trebouxia sp. A1-2]
MHRPPQTGGATTCLTKQRRISVLRRCASSCWAKLAATSSQAALDKKTFTAEMTFVRRMRICAEISGTCQLSSLWSTSTPIRRPLGQKGIQGLLQGFEIDTSDFGTLTSTTSPRFCCKTAKASEGNFWAGRQTLLGLGTGTAYALSMKEQTVHAGHDKTMTAKFYDGRSASGGGGSCGSPASLLFSLIAALIHLLFDQLAATLGFSAVNLSKSIAPQVVGLEGSSSTAFFGKGREMSSKGGKPFALATGKRSRRGAAGRNKAGISADAAWGGLASGAASPAFLGGNKLAHQQIWMAGQALELWPLHPVASAFLLMTKRVAVVPVLALQERVQAWQAAPARPGEAPGGEPAAESPGGDSAAGEQFHPWKSPKKKRAYSDADSTVRQEGPVAIDASTQMKLRQWQGFGKTGCQDTGEKEYPSLTRQSRQSRTN